MNPQLVQLLILLTQQAVQIASQTKRTVDLITKLQQENRNPTAEEWAALDQEFNHSVDAARAAIARARAGGK